MFPVELQLLVLDHLYLLDSDNTYRSLTNGRLVCHVYNAHLTPKVYHTVSVSSPQRYTRLMQQLPNMSLVKCLDLSAYTTMGSGWTDAKALTVVNAESLALLIRSCSRLEELLMGDGMGNIIDDSVIRSILSRPFLRGLDMIACSSPSFAQSMSSTMGNLESATNQLTESLEPRAFESRTDPYEGLVDEDSNSSVCSALSRRNSLDCGPSMDETTKVTLPTSLSRLSLHMCSSLSETSVLVPLLSGLSSLTHVDLSHTKVTAAAAWKIPSAALKELSLRYCRGLSCCNAGLPYLVACYTELEYLNLAMNPNLGGSRFCGPCLHQMMINLPPRLKTLDISGSLELTDEHLAAIPGKHDLEKLSIAHCRGISLNALMELIKRSPKLHYINVAGLNSVESTLPSLLKLLKCETLTVTEISDQVHNVLPSTICGWKKSRLGRRCYLSRILHQSAGGCQPETTTHSYKVLIGTDTLSPLMKYWSYAV